MPKNNFPFAKLFDTEAVGQLLVYIEYDDTDEDDGDVFVMHQIFQSPVAMVDVSIRAPEAVIVNAFKIYGQEQADALFRAKAVQDIVALGGSDAEAQE